MYRKRVPPSYRTRYENGSSHKRRRCRSRSRSRSPYRRRKRSPSPDPTAFVNLNRYNRKAISILYRGKPCSACAIRMSDKTMYSAHLDSHFKENKLKNSGLLSKKWNLKVSDWKNSASPVSIKELVVGPEPELKKRRKTFSVVLARLDQSNCALCMEPFEKMFHDRTGEWIVCRAKDVGGATFHTECLAGTPSFAILQAITNCSKMIRDAKVKRRRQLRQRTLPVVKIKRKRKRKK